MLGGFAQLVAATDVPSGIPTGAPPSLPPGVADAATRLIGADPVLGSICVLLVAGLVGMWLEMRRRQSKVEADREAVQKAHDDDRDDWQRDMQAERDKRVDELRSVITALNNSTASMSVFAQTQADRTSTLQELANKQDRVSMLASNNAEMLDRNLKIFQDRIGELTNLVGKLIGGRNTAGNGGN